MIKNLLTISMALIISTTYVQAHEFNTHKMPHKPSFKEKRQMDTLLNERLNLSQEQQEQIKKNRADHKKEMSKIIDKMQELHDKIRNVYYSGIPKFQADIKTATMKAELVLLKQNADKLRLEHRKKFESILNEDQKIKFKEIRKELYTNHNKKVPN